MIDLFCLQLLLVVSPGWNAVEGALYRYQRSSSMDQWQLAGSPVAVTLGKQGMAWGLADQEGLDKVEGDERSPAGIFPLGSVFGDALHQTYARNMPFLPVTDDLECVDDPDSAYYNQFVYGTQVAKRDWKSSEKMKETGSLYATGIVIGHNSDPVRPGRGSAIFMHIWRDRNTGTAGCTAMEEKDLNELVSWLHMEQHPRLVQLPLEEYIAKKSPWGLPDLP